MRGRTHFLLGAIAGYCAYPTWTGITAGAVIALLPDIDKADSKAGKRVWPLSWLVDKAIGHRTVTHSWVMLMLPAFFLSPNLIKVWFYSLLSHLVTDALLGRIQFFWPLKTGWIGIPLPKKIQSVVDNVTFLALVVYLVRWAYEGRSEILLIPLQ